MNWIAQKFDELKARVEKHIPATNKRFDDIESSVMGLKSYTQAAVGSLEERLKALEAAKT